MSQPTTRLADIASSEWASERNVKHSFVVEKWQTTVYWSAWTMADYDAVFGPTAPRGNNGRAVRVIVTKAQDENGKPLFVAPEEDQLLSGARPEIVTALAAAIVETMPKADGAKDAAKN